MMKKTLQIAIVLLLSSGSILGQTKETKETDEQLEKQLFEKAEKVNKKQVKTADKHFQKQSYVKAAKAYKKLAAKKNPTEHVLKRLGDSYYENVLMEKASEAYARLFENFKPNDPEYFFKYAQSLRAIENFDESKKWMEKFHQSKKIDTRGKNFTDDSSVLSAIKYGKSSYQVNNLRSINTKFSDFGVTEFENTLYYSSPAKSSNFIKRTHARNEMVFLGIYKVNKDKVSTFGEIRNHAERFTFLKENNMSLKYHESSVSFSPNKKVMYFTRNNFLDREISKSEERFNNLKIYKAKKGFFGKWEIEELPFCSDDYSVGHPSVSKDGKRLYFTSDMPGSIGMTDIYYTNINDDGTYGDVVNAGTAINTEGREMFPYISDDNVLYFSSDGHFGIGALDVFSSNVKGNSFTSPTNLKSPVNSPLDDFAFSINSRTRKGYLSSNRKGGVGDDDIYLVSQLYNSSQTTSSAINECEQVVTGIVRDEKSRNPLIGARLILKDASGTIMKDTFVSQDGTFDLKDFKCSEKYTLFASKENYKSKQISFEVNKASNSTLTLDFDLNYVDNIRSDFKLNGRNELILKIDPIYFDFDKSNIRRDASYQLDEVVRIMKKYPTLRIRSSSHTDSSGNDSYNERLSHRRAMSTVNYIIYKGINPFRIIGQGFGEYQLTNNCANGVLCSEDEHQANRRTEFVVESGL